MRRDGHRIRRKDFHVDNRGRRARLLVVALLGGAIGWFSYEIVYWLNPLRVLRAPTSWTLTFTVGVARQHALHRRFTFCGRGPYWPSLARAYRYYALVAVVGASLDTALIAAGVSHHVAWLACLAVTATSGLLLLERCVFEDTKARVHG